MAGDRYCYLPDTHFAVAATRRPAAEVVVRNSSDSVHNIPRREYRPAVVEEDTGCYCDYCSGTWSIRFPCKAADPVGAVDGLRRG